jgi:hypothetical protein
LTQAFDGVIRISSVPVRWMLSALIFPLHAFIAACRPPRPSNRHVADAARRGAAA